MCGERHAQVNTQASRGGSTDDASGPNGESLIQFRRRVWAFDERSRASQNDADITAQAGRLSMRGVVRLDKEMLVGAETVKDVVGGVPAGLQTVNRDRVAGADHLCG